MSKLVEELKNEHAMVVAALEKVKKLGIGSQEGQEALASVKEALLGHLKKEDEQFYPTLKKAAQNNPRLARSLEAYAGELAEVSKAALQFFEKYARGGISTEFTTDFGKLSAALADRIRKEESYLYAEYDKL